MNSPTCSNCEDARQVPGVLCYLGTAQVAELTGLDEVEIGLALRVGTLPLPAARGIHGERLWSVRDVQGYVARHVRQEARQ